MFSGGREKMNKQKNKQKNTPNTHTWEIIGLLNLCSNGRYIFFQNNNNFSKILSL